MIRSGLPIAPVPYPDELMSSWIERIGIFYGIDYYAAMADLLPHAGPAAWVRRDDVDADRVTHDELCAWVGLNQNQVPAVLDPHDPNTLDPIARLTYCPACWDDDVSRGGQPYLRRQWALWSTVSCKHHRTWLCARRPRIRGETPMSGWSGIWRSKPHWAQAMQLSQDPRYDLSKDAFTADMWPAPEGEWLAFEAAARELVRRSADTTLDPFGPQGTLTVITGDEFATLRHKVSREMRPRAETVQVREVDLKGYRRSQPGWIVGRIECIAIGVEIARQEANQPPLFPRVRRFTESAECAHDLRLRFRCLAKSGNFPMEE